MKSEEGSRSEMMMKKVEMLWIIGIMLLSQSMFQTVKQRNHGKY